MYAKRTYFFICYDPSMNLTHQTFLYTKYSNLYQAGIFFVYPIPYALFPISLPNFDILFLFGLVFLPVAISCRMSWNTRDTWDAWGTWGTCTATLCLTRMIRINEDFLDVTKNFQSLFLRGARKYCYYEILWQ